MDTTNTDSSQNQQVSPENNLPSVVWLQGNEPFFSEFSLNAEEVMERLGIKRSRLRQISGKELRVGRTRVEKYIKPVYRPEDVKKYLEWTRAAASHLRSTTLIQSATQKLSEQHDELLKLLDERLKHHFAAEKRQQDYQFLSLTQEINLLKNSITKEVKKHSDIQQENSQTRFHYVEEKLKKISDLEMESKTNAIQIQALKSYLAEAVGLIQSQQKTMQLLQNSQKSLESIAEDILNTVDEKLQSQTYKKNTSYSRFSHSPKPHYQTSLNKPSPSKDKLKKQKNPASINTTNIRSLKIKSKIKAQS